MSDIKDGGNAFPTEHPGINYRGMSLRDYFAGQAMARFVTLPTSYEKISKKCYYLADAMIKARGL